MDFISKLIAFLSGPKKAVLKTPQFGVNQAALDGDPLPKRALPDVKGDARWILSIDGGGVRGIIALRALKEFQATFSPKPDITEMFDMIAGTSTGSIIAAMLADGHSVDEVIDLYANSDTRHQIFTKNTAFQERAFGQEGELDQGIQAVDRLNRLLDAFGVLMAAFVAAAIVASWGVLAIPGGVIILALAAIVGVADIVMQFVMNWAEDQMSHKLITPYYVKNIRDILHDKFADRTLESLKTDILITSRDTNQNATMFFSCFDAARAQGKAVPNATNFPNDTSKRGTFRKLKIRDAVECSMSAPLFFSAHDRFIDGGVGAYNNPAAVAAIEAIKYSAPADVVSGDPDLHYDDKKQLYAKGKVTVWSFGTGAALQAFNGPMLKAEHDFQFWLTNLISQTFQDSNDQQHWICRDMLSQPPLSWIEYHRYQLYVGPEGLTQVGIDPAPFTPDRIQKIMALDNVDDFDSLDTVATAFGTLLGLQNTHGLNFDSAIVEVGKPVPADMSIYADSVRNALSAIHFNDERGDS